MNERQPLDLGRLGADAFKPKTKPKPSPSPQDDQPKAAPVRTTARFPSREVGDSQMNIKGPEDLLNRFREIAKRDGLRASGLLKRALDAYERGEGKEL